MWGYRRRLERDVHAWQARGLISPEAAATILAEQATARGPSLGSVLAVLAAVLLGFAAMSFVAANWQAMPKLARLALILTTLAACYSGAALLYRQGREALAHGAALAGVLAFGAAIMLVSQMYHVDGHPPNLLLIWGLGALATGLLAHSPPSLAAAMVLFLGWSLSESSWQETAHWPFLAAWSATAAGFFIQRWRPGMHVAGLALAAWVILLPTLVDLTHPHLLVAGAGVVTMVAALLLSQGSPTLASLAPATLGYGAVIAVAGLIGSQLALNYFSFPVTRSDHQLFPIPLLLRAVPTLALLGGALAFAWRGEHRGLAKVLVGLVVAQLLTVSLMREGIWLIPIVGVVVMAAGHAEQSWAGRPPAAAAPVVGFGLVVAFFGLFDLQFSDLPLASGEAKSWLVWGGLGLLALISLALIVSVLWWAVAHRLTKLQWLGFGLFAVEVFAIYGKTIGSLLGSSLFFLIAGLILAGLAALAVRLHAHAERTDTQGDPV